MTALAGPRRPNRSRDAGPLRLAVAAAAGYLCGSLPVAELVARYGGRRKLRRPVDLRTEGYRNPGALNASKVLGGGWGAVVMVGDIAKGALGAVAGRRLAGDSGGYMAGVAAVAGHCYPSWNGFRGGKGVAASVGSALVCFPAYSLPDTATGLALYYLSGKRTALPTLLTSTIFCAAAVSWWRKGRANLWGPNPTLGLPLYAVGSTLVIASRFRRETRSDLRKVRGGFSAKSAVPPDAKTANAGGPASRRAVELLWFKDCPNHEKARRLLLETLHGNGAQFEFHDIDASDPDLAAATRFPGSPTIRVDGIDVEPEFEDPGDYTPRCRIYRTPSGFSDIPMREWIEEAIERALTPL